MFVRADEFVASKWVVLFTFCPIKPTDAGAFFPRGWSLAKLASCACASTFTCQTSDKKASRQAQTYYSI